MCACSYYMLLYVAVQDTFDKLLTGKSISQRGTLSQLKNDFSHRSVTSTVMNCFNHAENFIRFVTEAHVVYRGLQLAGIDDVDSDPNQPLTSAEQLVTEITEQIVQECWLLPCISDVKAVAECQADDNDERWCLCEAGIG